MNLLVEISEKLKHCAKDDFPIMEQICAESFDFFDNVEYDKFSSKKFVKINLHKSRIILQNIVSKLFSMLNTQESLDERDAFQLAKKLKFEEDLGIVLGNLSPTNESTTQENIYHVLIEVEALNSCYTFLVYKPLMFVGIKDKKEVLNSLIEGVAILSGEVRKKTDTKSKNITPSQNALLNALERDKLKKEPKRNPEEEEEDDDE